MMFLSEFKLMEEFNNKILKMKAKNNLYCKLCTTITKNIQTQEKEH